jgi:4-phospho-D-threonate 3-dehydrogenase / 4-phospho-D-erythronate 3-dehydrogenase
MLPLIAITMGDPAGIGPEIIARAWRDSRLHALGRCIVLGSPVVMRRAAEQFSPGLAVRRVTELDSRITGSRELVCLDCVSPDAQEVPAARIDARGGQAAYEALREAARLALAGEVDAIVTAPLHKAALHAAGWNYPGHTEMLAEFCGVSDFAMMLYLAPGGMIKGSSGLGVVHVTLHMALRNVFAHLTSEEILAKIELADRSLRPLQASLRGDSSAGQRARPRLAACALNPHGGEFGLFGDEEIRIIEPAVAMARSRGIDCSGPLPADTLMVRAAGGEFDGVIAMYHDQGHIALKLLGMHRAVNVTLGLPIIRTSVAHGTAFDLAWRGEAQWEGLIEAYRVAAQLAQPTAVTTHES